MKDKNGKINKKKLAKFYISMIAIIYILFCLTAVSANALVYVTPSATWDIRTPPPTPEGTPDVGALFPTITATANNTCPVFTPVGYGTLTPGLNWLLSCGACLPAGTTTPTFDFNSINLTNAPIGTATPTVTGTLPTSTTTATATITMTPTATVPPASYILFDSWSGAGSMSCVTEGAGIACTYSFINNSGGGLVSNGGTLKWIEYGSAANTAITIDGTATGNFWYDMPTVGTTDILSGSLSQPWSSGFAPAAGLGNVVRTVTRIWHGGSDDDFDGFLDIASSANEGASSDFSGVIYIYPVSVPFTPTPGAGTPTTTPTYAPNYCDVIDESDYDYESWFDLIGLTGSHECFYTPYISASDYFGSGWMSFFNFLFPDEVVNFIAEAVIPAQTWCFYGFGFTNIQLFTVMLDPTIFADMGIILFVIAHFLNK